MICDIITIHVCNEAVCFMQLMFNRAVCMFLYAIWWYVTLSGHTTHSLTKYMAAISFSYNMVGYTAYTKNTTNIRGCTSASDANKLGWREDGSWDTEHCRTGKAICPKQTLTPGWVSAPLASDHTTPQSEHHGLSILGLDYTCISKIHAWTYAGGIFCNTVLYFRAKDGGQCIHNCMLWNIQQLLLQVT